MKAVIYGLRCPIAGAIRYIGKSSEVHKRYKAHLYSASAGRSHKERWIATLVAVGQRPELVILEEVLESEWQTAETKWIAQAVSAGWPLTNSSAGGDGMSPLDARALAAKKQQMSRESTRKKMSESAKARWADPEKRARGLAALSSEDRRAKASAAARARSTPEYRAMMSARSKAAWADAQKRARIVGGITHDTRHAVGQAAQRMWSDASAEKRAAMLSNLRLTP